MAYHRKISIVGSVVLATDNNNDTGYSTSHTLSAGRDRHVVAVAVAVDGDIGALSFSVTYDGAAMTGRSSATDLDAGNEPGYAIWSYSVPNSTTAGSKTVTFAWGGNLNGARVAIFELANVDPTTPEDAADDSFNGNQVTTSNASVTTVSDRAFLLHVTATDAAMAITPNSSQTVIDNANYSGSSITATACIMYLNNEAAGAVASNASFSNVDIAGGMQAFRPIRRRGRSS